MLFLLSLAPQARRVLVLGSSGNQRCAPRDDPRASVCSPRELDRATLDPSTLMTVFGNGEGCKGAGVPTANERPGKVYCRDLPPSRYSRDLHLLL